MYKETSKEYCDQKREQGFSLIELLIAVVIFLTVMAAVFGVLRTGIIVRNSINNRSETVSNARTAINSVGREAVNAGLGYSRTGSIVADDFAYDLLKIPKDSGNERDLFTGVMAGNNINSSKLSKNGQKNDVIAFVYRDLYFNDGEPVIVTDAGTFFNSPYMETETNGCVNCKKYDLYLVESADGNKALGLATDITFSKYIYFNDNDPLGLNKKTNGNEDERSILTPCTTGTSNCFNYDPQATIKKVYLISYRVNNDGTLIRTTYGNNTGEPSNKQIQEHPLAYNVQNFQVKYLMQDGTISDDPSNGNTEQSKMNEVVQVEITITIQAENNEDGVSTTKLINLTSTFSTRNLRYDNE